MTILVLHAHWLPPAQPLDPGGVLFWSESSRPLPPEPRARGKRAAPPHPFCASREETTAALAALGAGARPMSPGSITLWLPTADKQPLPSPHLPYDEPVARRGAVSLQRWQVEGVLLRPEDANVVLAASPAPDLEPSLRLGDDFRFWTVVAALVLEVLAQQKLLPTLEAGGAYGEYHARWLPILDGPRDGPRLAQLAAQMPAICRAGAATPQAAPAPDLLIESFLNTTVDALARHWGRPQAPQPADRARDPAHDWLAALFSDDPRVAGAPAQLERLVKSHRTWLRVLRIAGDRNFRVAFRLEAPQAQPDPDSRAWQLHFLLQARDDPSLLVPAGLVWQSDAAALPALGRPLVAPQEKLLAALGYVARLFPPLRRSLDASQPDAVALTSTEVFDFMRSTAPLLEDSGFGVMTPPWWNQPGARLGVRLHMQARQSAASAPATGGFVGFDQLVRYDWQLSLGDTDLTRAEFEALVGLKSPLVQIRGQWVMLDAEQIEAAIRFWARETSGEIGMAEALRLALGDAPIDGLAVQDVVTDGWLAEWMARVTGNEQMALLPQPPTLQAQLRHYQQVGYSWLDFLRRWQLGACLADDMGLGKTIQTLAMLLRAKEEHGNLPGPVLLICPTSVVTNWAREIERFAPALTVLVHQGAQRLQADELIAEISAVDMVLTSYAVVRRDAEVMRQVLWFGVVLDEAQNIKNAETRQARAIRQLQSAFRIALTGTPVENRLSELWSIMHFLNPGYLGSHQQFRQHYALPIERDGDPEAVTQLRRLIFPFLLRRVKTDPAVISDLPEKQETKVYCYLTPEQATLYAAVVRESLEQISTADEGIERRDQVLAMLLKLKQICNHPAQFLHQVSDNFVAGDEEKRSGKLVRLVELLDEAISVGDRVLIFTQFTAMGDILKSYLQQRLGVNVQFLHGGTKVSQRTEMVRRFQEDADGPPIFLLSLKAGGVGLNLTRANHVFHFDRWWNPAVENQATDRAFRIGQRRNVQVHKFVCTGTLEEKIDEMIESKRALAANVISGGEQWLTELSTAQLRDLVTLRQQMLE